MKIEDIEKSLANMKYGMQATIIGLLFGITITIFQFYSTSCYIVTISDNDVLIHRLIIGQIVTGVTIGIFLCLCLQCIMVLTFRNFLLKIIDKMKQMKDLKG